MSNHTPELDELYSQLKDKPWADISDDDDNDDINTWNGEVTRDQGPAGVNSRFMSVTSEAPTVAAPVAAVAVEEAQSWRATMLPTSTTPIKSPSSNTTTTTTPKPGSVLAGIYNTLTTDAARIEEALRREREEQAELKKQVDANWREREARMREEGERLARERGIDRDTRARAMEKEIMEIRRSHNNPARSTSTGFNRSSSPSYYGHQPQSHTVILSTYSRTPRIKQIYVKPSPDQPEMIIQLH